MRRLGGLGVLQRDNRFEVANSNRDFPYVNQNPLLPLITIIYGMLLEQLTEHSYSIKRYLRNIEMNMFLHSVI